MPLRACSVPAVFAPNAAVRNDRASVLRDSEHSQLLRVLPEFRWRRDPCIAAARTAARVRLLHRPNLSRKTAPVALLYSINFRVRLAGDAFALKLISVITKRFLYCLKSCKVLTTGRYKLSGRLYILH